MNDAKDLASDLASDLRGRTVFICRDFMLTEVLDDVAARLQRRGAEVIRGPESLPGKKVEYPRERWAEWFGQAEVAMFSSRNLGTREVMQAAPRLRGIVNPTIGLETVDLAAAGELGLAVGHGAVPENFLAMAEATVMLILMQMYNPVATSEVAHGRRERPRPTVADMWARMVRHRTIGLVGFGRIGRGVAERLQGWQARILAHDPYVSPASVPEGVSLASLDKLLRESDVVVVLVAVTPDNVGMIGERELGLMKREAFLINTGRGQAINEAALTRALADRRIAGAALDTFEVEPLPADSPLRKMYNVFLTPHMVGHTKDVFAAFGPAAEENISRILGGQLPQYCKNPEVQAHFAARCVRLDAARLDAARK
jgi:phosphoglycerate dehydrogenase-like enzyme